MTTIAISYRRDDTGPISGRIYDRLCDRFGPQSVFMDIEAIPAGKDFRAHIRETIAASDALVVIVGQRWLGKRKAGARIFEDDDWVRTEVEIALDQKVPIVPVLIDRAAMPGPDQLPPSVRDFAYLQAASVQSGADFHPHMNRLIQSIESRIEARTGPARSPGAVETDSGPSSVPARARRWLERAANEYLPSWAAPVRILAAKRSARYWLGAFAVLLIGAVATPYIEDRLNLAPVRDAIYQKIAQFQPRAIQPRFTKVVLIDDNDFWMGKPAGRRPIDRDYLADVVDRLSAADAEIIALDFDVRLPNPDAAGVRADIPAAYRSETDRLVRSIERAAALGRKIVLSKSIWFGDRGGYKFLADIYQPYGICTRLNRRGKWVNPGVAGFPIDPEWSGNISCGYIALPYDMRMLPPSLEVGGGGRLDSFSLAIARQFDPDSVARLGSQTYFGSYIPEAALAASHSSVTAGAALNARRDSEFMRSLSHKAIIVGGHWHLLQFGEGEFVDMQQTPVGTISGAVVHQNFVEAVLDGRHTRFVPEWVFMMLTLVFGAVALVVFARRTGIWSNLATMALLLLFLLAVQWVMMQTLGTFFDAFIILVALWLHSLLARKA